MADKKRRGSKRSPLKPEIIPFSAADNAIEELLGVHISNVLTRVFTTQAPREHLSGSGLIYVVRDRFQEIVLAVSPVDMPDDDERAGYVLDRLRSLFCTMCGVRLLEEEVGQCVSCESTSIMDLVRMRDELAES